jgi:calcium-dependent protein kinase
VGNGEPKLVLELCASGELFDKIIQRGHYSEKATTQLVRVIFGVIEVFHSLGVMHTESCLDGGE